MYHPTDMARRSRPGYRTRGARRLFRAIVIGAASALALAACSSAGGSSSTSGSSTGSGGGTSAAAQGASSGTAANGGEKTIAISFPNASTAPVIQNMFRLAKIKAQELGYKLIFDDPGTDENKQVNVIRTWIHQGVAAIVASTIDPDVVDTVAKEARAAGIKWVTFANSIADQDATLGFPHKDAGVALGKAAGKWITDTLGGNAKVGILAYSPAEYARERTDGVLEGLKATAPNAKVVATQDALSATDGLAKTSAMLQANSGLDVVLAIEDAAGQGAYQAFLNAGHAKNDPKVFIGGIDGAQDELKLVQEGTMFRATAAFNQKLLGEGFVTLPDQLLHGKTGNMYTPVELVENGNPDIARLLSYYGSN